MQMSFDIESLLNALEKDQGAFSLTSVIPDDLDPTLFHCHIRSKTFKKLYDAPEADQGLSVCYDAERKLVGLFIRVYTDIPNAAYAWALEFINDLQQDETCFSQMSIEAEDDTDEEEGCLALECSYHLSTRRHARTRAEHERLMASMIGDAMQRMYTESYHQATEMDSAFEEHCDTPLQ